MKRRPGSAVAAAALALAGALTAGCGPSAAHLWAQPKVATVWPLPPAPPRVRHEGTITAGQALRFSRGRFVLLDLLFGPRRLQLVTPHGVAVNERLVAIADSGRAELHLVSLAERKYRAVTAIGDARLRCPVGVALDGTGGVFVSDSVLRRVFRVSERGGLLGEVAGKFVRPAGLAYDAARGRLFVVDAGAHAVLVFERQGDGFALARTLGGRGEAAGGFNFPTHAAVGRDGSLYVTDSLNHRIQIFDAEGRRVGAFGRAGDGTGDFAKAKGIALDSEGHIYVVDSLYDVVQVFDHEGRLLLVFGGSGRDAASLWLPTGICIDEKDRIYVSDSANSRVQVYQYLRESE
ncbi:MAG TPA: 6-bladed beta-propeller [Planctomycetota bacterium]|nr:6-bladed beta-propeller [Planctomycetota bacterium]